MHIRSPRTFVLFMAPLVIGVHLARGDAALDLTPVDKATGQPVACRVHLKTVDRKPYIVPGLPAWKDHFVVPGPTTLTLPEGTYSYEIERGPEYFMRSGEIVLASGGGKLRVELERMTNMAARGWWSGELHVHRPLSDIETLMRAEDLHVAPVITWWGKRNLWHDRPIPADLLVRFDGDRFYHVMAGEDERNGGALMYFNLRRPLDLTHATPEYPSPVKFLEEARKFPGVRVDIEKPFWWDVPVWLATGKIDTIGLANNHMDRSQMFDTEAWGKPRDATRLPPPVGNGYWTQEIYYHILDCGLRIPPSAGSASGVLPNPVGYNRVYVQVDGDFTYEKWWDGLCAGRSFVTNGPMLVVRAGGELPGRVFRAEKELELDVAIDLIAREPIRAIEIIQDGKIVQTLPASAKTTKVKFAASGWLLVRAIAENGKTFRFASTAPFYVEIGNAPRRISRSSVRFFLDWVDEREQRIKLSDPDQLREVRAPFEAAKEFWRGLLEKANAD